MLCVERYLTLPLVFVLWCSKRSCFLRGLALGAVYSPSIYRGSLGSGDFVGGGKSVNGRVTVSLCLSAVVFVSSIEVVVAELLALLQRKPQASCCFLCSGWRSATELEVAEVQQADITQELGPPVIGTRLGLRLGKQRPGWVAANGTVEDCLKGERCLADARSVKRTPFAVPTNRLTAQCTLSIPAVSPEN